VKADAQTLRKRKLNLWQRKLLKQAFHANPFWTFLSYFCLALFVVSYWGHDLTLWISGHRILAAGVALLLAVQVAERRQMLGLIRKLHPQSDGGRIPG